MLEEQRIGARLPVAGLGQPFYFYEEVGSTNDRALALAREGTPHGTLILAESQTAGKGRGGRNWHTPPGAALALSLVLKSKELTIAHWPRMTVVGALAVSDALDSLGLRAQIKWPNDVLLDERKVAGILVEALWKGQRPEQAVLGIGVNVRPPAVPPEDQLGFPATCVEEQLGKRVDRLELLFQVLTRTAVWLWRLTDPGLIKAWNLRLAFRGRWVRLQMPQGPLEGRLERVQADGRLVISLGPGRELPVSLGDVRLRPVGPDPGGA